MPVYIYYCPRQKKNIELFKHKWEEKAICPECEKEGEIIQLKLNYKETCKPAANPFNDISWFKHQ